MFGRLLTGVIGIYRNWISPWTPPSCRFQPTCSAYAQDAIERHGAWKGSGLALRRILRCHPWGGSGWDPVPAPDGGAEAPPGEDDVEDEDGSVNDAGSNRTTDRL